FQKVDQDVHEPLPARFMLLHQRMWRGGWLQSYQDLSNIEFALHRMSQRSPRMADLTTTFEVLDGEYAALESNFSELYQDVLRQSLEFHQQLSSS
ncbi:ACP phosphodiesterase, partial [Vibrio parahaemolyticus]